MSPRRHILLDRDAALAMTKKKHANPKRITYSIITRDYYKKQQQP